MEELHTFTIHPEEVFIIRQARDGFHSVRSDRFISIEMDFELDEELIVEGLAREFVHAIQQIRKEARFRVEQRIEIEHDIPDGQPLRAAINLHGDYIQQETLANSLQFNLTPKGDYVKHVEIDGQSFTLGIVPTVL